MPVPALRHHRPFRRYWLARVCSLAGTAVTYVAMPVLVYQLTRSNLWTALVTVAEAAPYLLIGLFAGAIADRTDRRRLMVAADLVNAALLASVPLAYAGGVLSAPHALAVALGSQSMFVFFDAANLGALPALVGRDRIPAALSAVYGTAHAVELVVPMLAGAALVVLPAAGLLAVDAISFFASALLIRGVVGAFADPNRTAGGERDLLAEVREGLALLWGRVELRILTYVGFVQCLAGGAFVGQLVPWADQTLHVAPDDGRIGILFASWGIGGLIASVLFPRISARFGEARTTLIFLPLSAAGAVLIAVAGEWLVAAASVAAWGVAYMIVAIAQPAMRQKLTPDRLQSRVHTAARVLSWGLGWPLGALLGGAVSVAASPRATMAAAAGVLVVGALTVWLSPLRRLAPAEA